MVLIVYLFFHTTERYLSFSKHVLRDNTPWTPLQRTPWRLRRQHMRFVLLEYIVLFHWSCKLVNVPAAQEIKWSVHVGGNIKFISNCLSNLILQLYTWILCVWPLIYHKNSWLKIFEPFSNLINMFPFHYSTINIICLSSHQLFSSESLFNYEKLGFTAELGLFVFFTWDTCFICNKIVKSIKIWYLIHACISANKLQ